MWKHDFSGVSCWLTSEARLQEHDWNHNGNISSRMFDVESSQLRCSTLGFALSLERSSSPCSAICHPGFHKLCSSKWQYCESYKKFCQRNFLGSPRNSRQIGRALAREPLAISEPWDPCVQNSLRTLSKEKCLLSGHFTWSYMIDDVNTIDGINWILRIKFLPSVISSKFADGLWKLAITVAIPRWDSLQVSFADIFKVLENSQSPATSFWFNRGKLKLQNFLSSFRRCFSRHQSIFEQHQASR
jgi:hypothetical protein